LPPPTYKTLAVLLLAVLVGLWAAGKAAAPAAEQQQQQHYSNVTAALLMLGVAVLTTGAQLSLLVTSRSAFRSNSVIKHHIGVVGLSNVWLHARVAGGSMACSIIWLLWQQQQQQQQNSWHSSSSRHEANDLLQSLLPGNSSSSSSNQGIQVAFWQSAISLAALGVAAAVLQQHQQQQSSSTNICGGSSHASSAAAASCAGAMPSLHIMYAIVLAVPVTSISSSVLLQDQPPLLFQAAAAVSVATVVFYHYTCSPTLQKFVCRLDKAVGDCGGWRGTLFRIWKAAFVVKVALLLLLPLYMATGSSSTTTTTSSSSSGGIRLTHVSNWLTNNSSRSSSSLDRLPGLVVIKESFPNSSFLQDSSSSTSDSGSSAVYQFPAGIAPQMLTAVTNTRFPADLLSLSEQQQQQQQRWQQQRWQQQMQALCPAVDCVSNASCTIYAPECCAYYNIRLLAFLDYFLQRQGLAGQYCAVYGSLLSAINDSWFSRTAAPDVGISGSALQLLQRLEIRRALWRHGYVLLSSITAADGADSSDATSFSSSNSGLSSRDSNSSSSSSSSQGLRVWRLCAHSGHPSHQWRRRFRPAQQQLKQDNAALTAARQAFIQLHLMWPANTTSTSNSSSGSSSSSTVGINWLSTLAPAPAASSGAGTRAAAAGPSAAAAAAAAGGAGASQWQLCLSDVVLLSSGAYGVNLSGLVFPAPDNTGLLLSSAYGAWQQLLQQQPGQHQGQGQDPARGQQDRAAEVEQHKAIAAAAAAGQKLGGGTVTAPLVRKEYARDVCLQKTLELLPAALDGIVGSSSGSDSNSGSSSVLADRGAGSSSTADGVGSGNERDSSTQPVSSSAVIIGSVDEGSAGRSDNSSSSDVNSSDTSSGRNPGSTTGISVAGALAG
jgi:hypothetical protein